MPNWPSKLSFQFTFLSAVYENEFLYIFIDLDIRYYYYLAITTLIENLAVHIKNFFIRKLLSKNSTSQVAQLVKNLPARQETQVRSLGQEHPLEKEMATHSSIVIWRIPWTEESGRLQSLVSQRVRHD